VNEISRLGHQQLIFKGLAQNNLISSEIINMSRAESLTDVANSLSEISDIYSRTRHHIR